MATSRGPLFAKIAGAAMIILALVYLNTSTLTVTSKSLFRDSFFLERPVHHSHQDSLEMNEAFGSDNVLDGCFHVYLDLGSNVGVQVRKLFEPEKYPSAPIIDIYRRFFGRTDDQGRFKESICAVGFEPNPHHSAKLKALQDAYSKCGNKVHFFTETAVSHKFGQAFFISDGDLKNLEWGGRISPDNSGSPNQTSVKMVRISDFILHKLMTRKIPAASAGVKAKPRVLMKMDIEGSELEVFLDLLMTGSLQYIDFAFIEWHTATSTPGNTTYLQRLRSVAKELSEMSHNLGLTSKFQLADVDDETYGTSDLPLPTC